MYIYQRKQWPDFFWKQEAILSCLTRVRHEQGRLLGQMEAIGFSFQQGAWIETLTQDVVKSSEIEGEILEAPLVRSSISSKLGVNVGAVNSRERNVEGIVKMVLEATQNYDQALTKERLFNWHRDLFPWGRSGFKTIEVGGWRKNQMEVISGQMGREIVHFEAPDAKIVDKEMKQFLNWFNQEDQLDFVLKAGIAHLWFVTIHPFDDGNGRIGRAISDMLLARSEKSSQRFYSLSAQIQEERNSYYEILEQTQKGGLDISRWLEWFLSCLGRAIEKARECLRNVLQKRNLWESIKEIPLNDRQQKVLNKLIEGFEGKLTSSKWAKIAKCSQDTASRDILDLIKKGILKKAMEGGRSTSYHFKREF